MSDDLRDRVRSLAAASEDGMSWFDDLYAAANGDPKQIPWADHRPNRQLVSWLERETPSGRGRKALVVGCGLGDDAELLSRWQFDVTAFDLSATAIDWCRRRFPGTKVNYVVADLLSPPPAWIHGWSFVFEAYTVQPLPLSMREQALNAVANLVAPGGDLLFVTRGRDADDDDVAGPPWPLTHADLAKLGEQLRTVSFEDYEDDESPPIRRFRALFTRDH